MYRPKYIPFIGGKNFLKWFHLNFIGNISIQDLILFLELQVMHYKIYINGKYRNMNLTHMNV